MKPDKPEPVDIDAAIDRAVRSIMSAEPRAGMRQRVLSRIHDTPSRAFPMLRLAMAGVGVAVVALAVTIRVGNWSMDPEEPAPVAITAPPPVTSPASRGQTNVPPVPPPISAAPPTRRMLPPSQRIPRGVVVAQSLPTLETGDPVPSRVGSSSPVLPELQRLQMTALPDIPELDTPVESMPAITMPPIGISNLQPIAPLQGPSR